MTIDDLKKQLNIYNQEKEKIEIAWNQTVGKIFAIEELIKMFQGKGKSE